MHILKGRGAQDKAIPQIRPPNMKINPTDSQHHVTPFTMHINPTMSKKINLKPLPM